MGVQKDVLGLVVEQPGYGYRIVKQLGDEYSSAAVYKALGKLQELDLIERVETLEEASRPQKWYRATIRGATLHREAVAKMLRERLENARPESITEVVDEIDEYERHVLDELSQNSVLQNDLVGDLIAAERRLVNQARLRWIAYARETINGSPSA